MQAMSKSVSSFMEEHFLHFNASVVVDAAKAYCAHLAAGNKMMITLAGAMSTAELGKSLAEMIRNDKVHIISCTGANLEEDLMNLIAHNSYHRVSDYRDLSPQDEQNLLEKGMNRVTDTCIPEDEAFRMLEKHLLNGWTLASQKGERFFPHEYLYQIIRRGVLDDEMEIPSENSWLVAAC